MAKRGSRAPMTTEDARASKTMVDFAEDLGRLLGTAQAKASNWMNQRKNVIDELTQLRDTANQLLRDLTGGSAATAATRSRGGRGRRKSPTAPRASAGTTGRRRTGRRPMSAAARKAVSQRMRKYWAARRKEKAANA
jgi:hypothetical protein